MEKHLFYVWCCLGGLLLLVATGCGTSQGQEAPQQAQAVATEVEAPAASEAFLIRKEDLILHPIRNSNKATHASINGRVIPQNETQLFAEVQGKIEVGSILFKEGVRFQKGAVLIQLEHEEFKLSLEAQRSAFLNALTGIMPDMKSDYPESYDQWLTYIQQYQFGASLPSLPQTQSDGEKYFITSNQIYNLYYSIKSQEERLKKYTIIAPYAGMISQTNIDVGSLVNPGQPLGTIISQFNFELEAGIDLELADQLKVGDWVDFSSNEIQGTWKGKVIRINNVIDPQTQNIPIYFRLKGKSLRTGMYLEGRYPLKALNEVAVIPNRVLGADESVLILEEDVIMRKAVKPLEYLGDSIIISGLTDRDLLILNQFDKPVEGNKVKI
ncbi:MAG: HlyD family efflux transporter periplasmic adaptor subunit [Bacteroidota bacterium]